MYINVMKTQEPPLSIVERFHFYFFMLCAWSLVRFSLFSDSSQESNEKTPTELVSTYRKRWPQAELDECC